MRISDWSSDVCASDLNEGPPLAASNAAAFLICAAERNGEVGCIRAKRRADPCHCKAWRITSADRAEPTDRCAGRRKGTSAPASTAAAAISSLSVETITREKQTNLIAARIVPAVDR